MESRRFASEGLGLVLALMTSGAIGAERLTFCCNDQNGRRYCSDVLPEQCYNREYRMINERGVTVRRVEAPLTPEQETERQAEAARRQEAERQLNEQRRRERALLESYSSEKDIDQLRDRALAELDKSIRAERARHAEALGRKKKLDEEMEFYRKSPPPPSLQESIRENESELRAFNSVIQAKEREREAIKTKYDEEKRRYIELIRARDAKPRGMEGRTSSR